MRDHHERPHLFLVGELLEQVLEDARRKLSGVVRTPDPIQRIARRRRRRPPLERAPHPSGDTRRLREITDKENHG